jgi:hypothetical protein
MPSGGFSVPSLRFARNHGLTCPECSQVLDRMAIDPCQLRGQHELTRLYSVVRGCARRRQPVGR